MSRFPTCFVLNCIYLMVNGREFGSKFLVVLQDLEQSAEVSPMADESLDNVYRYLRSNPDFHPGRRHHIAHFCPDLEEARKCIRKCLTEGKPAFCGKDHVCYCGHKTKNTKNEKGEKLDPKAIYGQFLDMYEFYFGKKREEKEEYVVEQEPPHKMSSEETGISTGDEVIEAEDGSVGDEVIEAEDGSVGDVKPAPGDENRRYINEHGIHEFVSMRSGQEEEDDGSWNERHGKQDEDEDDDETNENKDEDSYYD